MRIRHILFAMPLLLATGAQATTIFPVDRVCPVGGESYKSFEIGSTSSFGMRLDFRRIGPAGHLPIYECPNGFIPYKDEKEFTADDIAKLTPLVASAAFQDARANDMPSMRLVLEQRAVGGALDLIAYYTLKAAFEAEDAGKEDLRQKHLAEAADAYDAFIAAHPAENKLWWIAKIEQAEIARQRGRFDEAIALADALTGQPPEDMEWATALVKQIRTAAEARQAAPQPFNAP
jgi:hypothetical protein